VSIRIVTISLSDIGVGVGPFSGVGSGVGVTVGSGEGSVVGVGSVFSGVGEGV
tara:strand:+ start:783 stop:941 length:159 start_codon:yes stop_codon:yes gene_type:complete